LRQTNINITDC